MAWAKTTARGYKKHLSFGIWCDLYWRFYGSCCRYIDNKLFIFYLPAVLTTNAVTYKSLSNGKPEDGSHVSVAANETVGPTEGQTIMIIQEEPFDGSHLPAELTNPNTLELVPATEVSNCKE